MITTTEETMTDTNSNNAIPMGSSDGAPISEPARTDCPQSVPSSECVIESGVENANQNSKIENCSALSLLNTLVALIPRFVVLPKYAAEALALWIVHTYCFQFREVSTYIGIESRVKRCGKTTLLGALGKLVHRPVVASNISSSAFFRVIEELQPTLLIDEADTFLQGKDELRGIFNAGYQKPNAYVIRVSNEPASARKSNGEKASNVRSSVFGGGDGSVIDSDRNASNMGTTWSNVGLPPLSLPSASGLATYSCWCPKVIAGIGHLPETLADRCIIIRMERKSSAQKCERLRNLDSAVLRQECARFAMEHQQALAAAKPELPDALNDRAADIWEPLFGIADIAGGDWPERARGAAVALATGAQESSPISTLLVDICAVFQILDAKRLFTHQLLEQLNGERFAGRPWTVVLNGKPAGEKWLAQQLRAFGVSSQLFRIGDRVGKGYEFTELKEILAGTM